jgi:hypothetical protein
MLAFLLLKNGQLKININLSSFSSVITEPDLTLRQN